MAGVRRLGQGHRSQLQDIADAQLRGVDAVLFRHLRDGGVLERLAMGDGGVGLHLDALLTLARDYRYTPQSFIIVCTAEQMQLGLIIDKVQTMHTVEQDKITWNAEVQLGASADFLCGIADINDHVCGILAPDMIVQKLLAT